MGHQPTNPILFSTKEWSGKKVLMGKKSQNDPFTHPVKQIDQVDSESMDMG